MYATIRKYSVKPGTAQEVKRRVDEGFIPIINSTDGFVGYHLMEVGDDKLATISIFQSQAGADESNRRAADWVKQNIASFVTSPVEITAGEMLLNHPK